MFLALEIILRLSGRDVFEHRSLYVVSDIPGLIYENLPGFRGRYAHAPVRVNSRGLRGPEFEIEKREGLFRVIVLGDSFAFGHGVEDDETFPAQLGASLNEGAARPEFEVLNAGVNGYNTRQELAWLLERGLPLKPDLVILTFFHNDLGNPYEFTIEDGKLASRYHPGGVPIPRFIKTFLRERSALYWFCVQRLSIARGLFTRRESGENAVDRPFSAIDREGWEDSMRTMKRLRDACRAKGVGTLFLIHPELSPPAEFMLKAARAEFARFCEREGIPCLDLRDAFGDRDPTSLWVSRVNRHTNAEGNRLIAAAIAAWIREQALSFAR